MELQKSRPALLVEAEFGAWRKVVDHEGTTGWMRGSVLTLRRMVLVTMALRVCAGANLRQAISDSTMRRNVRTEPRIIGQVPSRSTTTRHAPNSASTSKGEPAFL